MIQQGQVFKLKVKCAASALFGNSQFAITETRCRYSESRCHFSGRSESDWSAPAYPR